MDLWLVKALGTLHSRHQLQGSSSLPEIELTGARLFIARPSLQVSSTTGMHEIKGVGANAFAPGKFSSEHALGRDFSFLKDTVMASKLGIKCKKLSFNFDTDVAFYTYGYRFMESVGKMVLHRFVGTMEEKVPGLVGAHFPTAGSKAGDSGTPCLDARGNLVGIRVGVYTPEGGEPRAVMVCARQIFNFMIHAQMIKKTKGGFLEGTAPPKCIHKSLNPKALIRPEALTLRTPIDPF